MKTVLALGPYIGSFEHEIMTFRPHMKWIEQNMDYKTVYLSTHFNRKFMYQGVSAKRFHPVYGQFTRQEVKQEGYCHTDVDQKDYLSLTRGFKDKIVENVGCIKKNIDHYSLPYVKYIPPVSVYHKIFEPIKVPKPKRKGHVVFIPDISMRGEDAVTIFDYLNDNCKFSVVGDMKCHLPEANEILRNMDYLQSGYQKIVTAVTNAKAVIAPCSHWTFLANLQGVPVISWGEGVGQFKEGGIYNFNNQKSRILYHDSDAKIQNIIRQIDNFLGEL